MRNIQTANVNTVNWIVVLLLFFLIDEVAFILYNISFFQFMCANTINLFFTDELPSYIATQQYNALNLLCFSVDASSIYSYMSVYSPFVDISATFDLFSSHIDSLDASSSSTDLRYANDLQTTYYKIKLEATNVKKSICSFYPLQHYIYTIPGESSLIFYRLENNTGESMQTLSVYVTTPSEAVAYIKKLQCFCYEELMIAPHSIIDLPILFSIDEEILTEDFKEITINYILLLK